MLSDALKPQLVFSDRLLQAVQSVNVTIAQEKQLSELLIETIDRLEEIMKDASVRTDGLITCCRRESTIAVSCHNRILAFTPAHGFARDSRLENPRCMLCFQILVFAHVRGQNASVLASNFRVYPDGHFSNGAESGSVGTDSFAHFLSELLVVKLFQNDLLWPDNNELSAQLKTLPVIEDVIDISELSHSCIGFECSFAPPVVSAGGPASALAT